MHVFITGATGFVGHYILQELLRQGHTPRCLVREGSEDKLPVPASARINLSSMSDEQRASNDSPTGDASPRVEIVYGSITDADSIQGDLVGCDAVIHLVGIIDEQTSRGSTFESVHVEGTRNIVRLAKAAQVKRFIYMSANGARPDPDASKYHTTKWQAEEIVRNGGFHSVVIFRPSIVFGDPGKDRPEFASRLASTLIRPFPILPVFGNGEYALQPVHIADVAKAFVDALTIDLPESGSAVYYPVGPEILTYVETLDRIAQGMGIKPKPKLYLPMWFSQLLVNTMGSIGLLPISPAQFRMLIEGNTSRDTGFAEDFQPEHTAFVPHNLTYLQRQ